jgi:hypothetical protein
VFQACSPACVGGTEFRVTVKLLPGVPLGVELLPHAVRPVHREGRLADPGRPEITTAGLASPDVAASAASNRCSSRLRPVNATAPGGNWAGRGTSAWAAAFAELARARSLTVHTKDRSEHRANVSVGRRLIVRICRAAR